MAFPKGKLQPPAAAACSDSTGTDRTNSAGASGLVYGEEPPMLTATTQTYIQTALLPVSSFNKPIPVLRGEVCVSSAEAPTESPPAGMTPASNYPLLFVEGEQNNCLGPAVTTYPVAPGSSSSPSTPSAQSPPPRLRSLSIASIHMPTSGASTPVLSSSPSSEGIPAQMNRSMGSVVTSSPSAACVGIGLVAAFASALSSILNPRVARRNPPPQLSGSD